MKKMGLLSQINNLKARNEQLSSSSLEYATTPTEIVLLLLQYLNDPQITEAVNDVPCDIRRFDDVVGNKESQPMPE